jgi:hypothetical protein
MTLISTSQVGRITGTMLLFLQEELFFSDIPRAHLGNPKVNLRSRKKLNSEFGLGKFVKNNNGLNT